MKRFLRAMRVLTGILILAAVLLVCWQVIDIYADGTADALPDGYAIFRKDDIVIRFKALAAPLSACGLVYAVTAILHLLAPGAAVSAHSDIPYMYLTNKTAPLKGRSKLRALIFCTAIAFILLGVMNGGAYDVLVKAINICTECIGLG